MLRRLACIALLVALGPASAGAQSALGTIFGTVADSSGAVIGNATVTVTNVDEGTSRILKTDANGHYEAVDSKPGHYSMQVRHPPRSGWLSEWGRLKGGCPGGSVVALKRASVLWL